MCLKDPVILFIFHPFLFLLQLAVKIIEVFEFSLPGAENAEFSGGQLIPESRLNGLGLTQGWKGI